MKEAYHLAIRLNLQEILDHIKGLSAGEFVRHEAKWGYKITAPGGFRHYEFVDFSIHSERGDHLRFSFYGKPEELGSGDILPLSKGRGDSYSECVFEDISQKNALIEYLSKSHDLSKRNKGGKWDFI